MMAWAKRRSHNLPGVVARVCLICARLAWRAGLSGLRSAKPG